MQPRLPRLFNPIQISACIGHVYQYALHSVSAMGLCRTSALPARKENRCTVVLYQCDFILYRHGLCLLPLFPLVFMFFTSVAPEGISVMPDIRAYLDFVSKAIYGLGLSFQIPIAVVIL